MKKRMALLGVVLALVCALPAQAQSVPLKGTVHASETDDFEFPIIHINGSGAGVATLLGQLTFDFTVTVDVFTGGGPATVHFQAENGDGFSAAGLGQAADEGDVVRITENYSITGGTGRFARLSGDFTIERTLNPVTGSSTGTISGLIARR